MLIGNGKRLMAYDIINRLELQKEQQLLTTLGLAVSPLERKRGKKHEVWEDSSYITTFNLIDGRDSSEKFRRRRLKLQQKRCPLPFSRLYLDISLVQHHDLLAKT
jgi:hypothetical protein